MGELLQADADALRGMGKDLHDTSDAIRGLKHTAAVTMPGSPIADLASQTPTVVTHAYGRISDNVTAMATAAEASARNYETFDAAFRDQLQRYQSGL